MWSPRRDDKEDYPEKITVNQLYSMKKIIFYRLFLTILVLFACTTMSNAQTFTQEDRARLIRTETKLEELEKRMVEGFEQVDKRFEQIDKRFEQVDKRFEDNFTYMGYLITLFGGMFAAIVAFALWDRRTMIRPFECLQTFVI